MISSQRTTSRAKLERLAEELSLRDPQRGVQFEGTIPFGAQLEIARFRLKNGLGILLLIDRSAKVVAFHTWFAVGSRHERAGKTGLAHLFEHLMFNAMEGMPPGEFDRRMEAAGADNNASTWLDFTQYQEAFPSDQLGKIIKLEALRMHRLVLGQTELDTEKDVVLSERRFRVDDDVDGRVDELLWSTAFEKHAYRIPTIGLEADIKSFTVEDLMTFYRAYYSPNNATLIVVGDFVMRSALAAIQAEYGSIPSSSVPLEETWPEPPQGEERVRTIALASSADRLSLGYKGPALGDDDHIAMSLLMEALVGGAASRLPKRLIRKESLVSDVRGSVGPHKDPSLIEFSAAAREGVKAETILRAIDEELDRVQNEALSEEEIARARSRSRLGLLSGLETADGKASTIGFYETVLRRPAAALERLERLDQMDQSDLLRVARRFLSRASRSVILGSSEGAS